MLVPKFLALLVVSVVMSSCSSMVSLLPERAQTILKGQTEQNECELGVPQTAQCWYIVKITDSEYKNKMVGGKASLLACLHNKKSDNDQEDCDGYEGRRKVRFFEVEDSPRLDANRVYDFDSVVIHDNPVNRLRCRREGDNCKVRTMEPDPCTEEVCR
jgi:hypothetical protein